MIQPCTLPALPSLRCPVEALLSSAGIGTETADFGALLADEAASPNAPVVEMAEAEIAADRPVIEALNPATRGVTLPSAGKTLPPPMPVQDVIVPKAALPVEDSPVETDTLPEPGTEEAEPARLLPAPDVPHREIPELVVAANTLHPVGPLQAGPPERPYPLATANQVAPDRHPAHPVADGRPSTHPLATGQPVSRHAAAQASVALTRVARRQRGAAVVVPVTPSERPASTARRTLPIDTAQPAQLAQPGISALALPAAAPVTQIAAPVAATLVVPTRKQIGTAETKRGPSEPSAKPVSPLETASPLASQPLAPLAASPPTIATEAQPQRPIEFAQLIDRLVTAREAIAPQAVSLTIDHAEFGPVQLRFRNEDTGLNVALASANPDFARAVQTASVPPPAPDSVAPAPQGRSDSPGNGMSDSSAQTRGQPGERREERQAARQHHQQAPRDEAQRRQRRGILA